MVAQELQPIRRLIDVLAPVVPTGGSNGQYNKFDTQAAFVAYQKTFARRAVGGAANAITLLNDVASFSAMPNGLRISVDEFERQQAGNDAGAYNLVEQAKTRVLTINSYTAMLLDVLTTIKASVSAEAGKGSWADANVDPITELNKVILAIYVATGIVPNNIVFDFGAWTVFQNNAKVRARMPGADVAMITPDRIRGLLSNPNMNIEIATAAAIAAAGGGVGSSSASKQSVLRTSVLVFFNSITPTQFDPSFCKTFSPTSNLFSDVFTYREEPHLDWLENNWTSQTVVVASSLCKRIDVATAYDV
jgi:hypothetical protein